MAAAALARPKPVSPTWRNFREALRRHPTAIVGGVVLLLMILVALLAPWLGTVDPQAVAPVKRLKQPAAEFWFGSDMMGRDVYSRVLYGARVSLAIGIAVAVFSTLVGLAIGLVTGFVRWLDADRDAGDGRADVDSAGAARDRADGAHAGQHGERDPRHHAGRDAARGAPGAQPGAHAARRALRRWRRSPPARSLPRILWRHILPNIVAPLLVQATYVCASAMITEAILSFIGAGTPPNIPSWGNIMAEARSMFQIAGYLILFPGICLSLTVLAVNLLGDGLRDALDPRLARRM